MRKKKFRSHFRKNKRINHPTYVVDKYGNVYKYIGITHSDNTNGVENIPLKKNPNPKDNKKSYMIPQVESDIEQNFGRRYKSWKLSDSDKLTVIKIKGKQEKKDKK